MAVSDDSTMDRVAAVTVGDVEYRPIVLADPDPTWAPRYEQEAAQIGGALGNRVLEIEHVGSTSVPDLPAKPVIDVLLIVAAPAQESAYVPDLEHAGYELRIREPDWYQHRVLCTPARDVNVHVFGPDSPEPARMLAFRDRLRAVPEERELYARTKRELAARKWPTVQHYADAKNEVVNQIMTRAEA